MPEATRALISPCPEHEENLVLLHYGDLGGADGETLRAHVQACAPCAGYLKDLGTLMPLTIAAAEPAAGFWSDYDRELRRKIDAVAESKSWTRKLAEFFQPRWLPAFATAAVLALALTFTMGRGTWKADGPVEEDAAILELMPVAENLEFLKAMDVLDNLDVLESMGAQGNAA